jgi:hypothetical protein
MAGVAGDPTRVIRCNYLRKALWLGAVGLVTSGTYDGGVQSFGLQRSGVVRVLGQSPVARLASDYHMFAKLFLVRDVGMASLADIVPGERNRPRRDLTDRRPSIVAVLPKTAGYHSGSQKQEDHQRYGDDGSQPNEVFDVFKQISVPAPIVPGAICARN